MAFTEQAGEGDAPGRGTHRGGSSSLFFPALARAPGREFRPTKRLLTAIPTSKAQTFAAQIQFGVLNLGSVSPFPLLPIHYLIPDNPTAILQKRRPRFSVDKALTPQYTAKWTELDADIKAIRESRH